MSRERFAAAMAALGENVSRETLDRLETYSSVLTKWQKAINLVSPATLPDLWTRHFLDSAQIVPLIPPEARRMIDLGSGAGFPGLVVAALRPDLDVALVESDQRKSAFLAAAAGAMGLRVAIVNRRIEAAAIAPADVVTARALAPLAQLCVWAHPLLAVPGICLFHKGGGAADELTAARQAWMIEADLLPSASDPSGAVVRIRRLENIGQ